MRSYDYQLPNAVSGKLVLPERKLYIPEYAGIIHSALKLGDRRSDEKDYVKVDERRELSADERNQLLNDFDGSGYTFFLGDTMGSGRTKQNLLLMDTAKLKEVVLNSITSLLQETEKEATARGEFLRDT